MSAADTPPNLGPTLGETCRALIQAAKQVGRVEFPDVASFCVAMHTSIDYREVGASGEATDPAQLTFPAIELIGPTMNENLERRVSKGFYIYRKVPSQNFAWKIPYPRFYHLDFQVRLLAASMDGPDGMLELVAAWMKFVQEYPTIAGLRLEQQGQLNPGNLQNGNEGDAIQMMGQVRLYDFRLYSGKAEKVPLITQAVVDIYNGDPPVIDWVIEDSGIDADLTAGFAADATDLFVCSDDGHILRSGGDGVWTTDASVAGAAFSSLWGSSPTDMYAAGVNGGAGVLYHSSSPGVWSAVPGLPSHPLFTCVFGLAANRVFVASSTGDLFVWNGTAWAALSTGVKTPLRAMCAGPAGSVIVVGDGGVILQVSSANVVAQLNGTKDSKGRFRPYVTADLYAVAAARTVEDVATIYAAGAAGVLLTAQSSDLSTWTMTSNGAGRYTDTLGAWATPNSAGEQTIVFVGMLGTVYRHRSIGWSPDVTGQDLDLAAVFGTDVQNVWVVGEGGLIMHYAEKPGLEPATLEEQITLP